MHGIQRSNNQPCPNPFPTPLELEAYSIALCCAHEECRHHSTPLSPGEACSWILSPSKKFMEMTKNENRPSIDRDLRRIAQKPYRHGDLVEARDVRVRVDGHQHVGDVGVDAVGLKPPSRVQSPARKMGKSEMDRFEPPKSLHRHFQFYIPYSRESSRITLTKFVKSERYEGKLELFVTSKGRDVWEVVEPRSFGNGCWSDPIRLKPGDRGTRRTSFAGNYLLQPRHRKRTLHKGRTCTTKRSPPHLWSKSKRGASCIWFMREASARSSAWLGS